MQLKLAVKIGDVCANALLDSGATGNFMDPGFMRKARLVLQQKKRPYDLGSFGEEPTIAKVQHETTELPLRIGRHHEGLRFDVTKLGDYDLVLGFPWLKQHNPDVNWQAGTLQHWRCDCPLVPEALRLRSHSEETAGSLATNRNIRAFTEIPQERKSSATKQCGEDHPTETAKKEPQPSKDIVPREYEEYRELFQEKERSQSLPKHQPWDHEIPLEKGQTPKFMPTYRLTEQQLTELRKYLDQNLEKGYIRPSTSSAGYPILFVPKKDGKLRLCVDYRQLNNITKKNRYPLPLIEEIQDRFQGTKWFTSLDVRDAYYRIRMKEGEEWKTAFRTRFGLYEYLVMPFGLTNAPATFQALINHALYEYLDNFVVAYLDDILIYTKGTREDHTEKVRKVLEKIKKFDLLLKPEKCEFFKKEVNFLGHIISTEGIRMDPDKIKAILEWPTPTTVKEVQAFHGLANYYRQYVGHFSDEVRPLVELFKKDKDFEWGPRQQKSFEKVKELFKNGDMRQHFDPQKPSYVDADASDCAIGARLQQPGPDGKLRLVACYARTMTPAEQNYDIHDKELLAIVMALKKWRVELQGARHQVTILSDHHNLQYFTTTKELTRRQARWSETLSAYDFKIKHCKGTENSWADALSRRPDLMTKQKETKALFKQDGETKDMIFDPQALRATRIVTPEPSITKDIKRETLQDAQAERLRQTESAEDVNGLLLYHGLVYVPRKIRDQVMQQGHDAITSGHFGIDKTMERLTRTYYWPGMWTDIRQYIRECDVCQRNKSDRHQPYGLLQPIPQLRKS
jgi:hypothetical protein